jgi:hypothetical protein
LNKIPKADAADFFFALDKDLDVNGKFPVELVEGFQGLEVDMNLALVVGRAATINVAVADGGLKGGRSPKVQRLGGLDIIVAIKKDGRFAGSFEGFGINERVKIGGDNFDVFEASGTETIGNPVGAAFDVGFMFAFGTDRRNTEEIVKLVQMLLAATFDKFSKVHIWASGTTVRSIDIST